MPHRNVQAKQIECVTHKAGASSQEEQNMLFMAVCSGFFASPDKVLLISRISGLKLY